MLYLAARILDLEMQAVDYVLAPEASPQDRLLLQTVTAYATSPLWIGVGISPYATLAQAHGVAKYALRDLAYTKAVRAAGHSTKYNTLTMFNFAPRTIAFGARGGGRLLLLKAGARFIPYVGWALLAYDLWSLGKWIGEKTSPV